MWFVSRQRYTDAMREKDGLQDRLFRANTAMRKLEIERDQAKAMAVSLQKQLEAAVHEIDRLEASLKETAKTTHERDELLAKLQAIKDLASHLPDNLYQRATAVQGRELASLNGSG